ncbi:hypothetical protein KACC15558_30710 [Brevibacterium ammoniilyticum]|uniref:DUF4190 domain-containing protein n=1 Tax=Brevibacterium ammoniilyticum TaxID=1046555 RepID=A0ABP9U377_9MICO
MSTPLAPQDNQHTGQRAGRPQFDRPQFDQHRDHYTGPQPLYAPQTQMQSRTNEDPGKVLGIISLVATLSTFLGFNFLGPAVGIVTGYMARRASKEGGFGDNEMGKWGFILGIVFIGIAVVGAILGISISAIAAMMGYF